MTMIKCNVAEEHRTPKAELDRPDENWDKQAADEFKLVLKPEVKAEIRS